MKISNLHEHSKSHTEVDFINLYEKKNEITREFFIKYEPKNNVETSYCIVIAKTIQEAIGAILMKHKRLKYDDILEHFCCD